MATTDVAEPTAMAEASSVLESAAVSKKSYRRKYRKIMVTFEEQMRENSTLFKEEQRVSDISQRLAEQNDQLLQLLLDLNACPQVPQRLRYDLNLPSAPTPQPQEPDVDEEEGHLELRKARHQLQVDEMDAARYREIESFLLQTRAFAPTRSYASLLATAAVRRRGSETTDPLPVAGLPVLTAKQEEDYLQSLDAFLDGQASHPRAHVATNLGSRSADRTTERERETQQKNPVSVYNWLRKHQPQVFLQDHEPHADKPARATGSRSSARKSAGKEVAAKRERDLYDDDGIALEVGSSAKGKRKRERDTDGGYRPKGGTSRGGKRKKEAKDDATRTKRAKKASIDAR